MKAIALIVAGLIGGLAGALVVTQFQEEPSLRASQAQPLEHDSDRLTQILERMDARQADIEHRLGRIEDRGPAAAPDAAVRSPAEGRTPAGSESAAPKPTPEQRAAAIRAMIGGIVGQPFGNREASRLFLWLTRNPDGVLDTIAELKAALKKDPGNADLNVALATAVVSRLASGEVQGPAAGAVWAEAREAYDTAIKNDPDHWQARFGKAFGTSMIPPFLGMRPDAIKQFEELQARQETGAPSPEHVETYYRLGTLYKDENNKEKALEIFRKGLERFPGNEKLKDAIDVATRK